MGTLGTSCHLPMPAPVPSGEHLSPPALDPVLGHILHLAPTVQLRSPAQPHSQGSPGAPLSAVGPPETTRGRARFPGGAGAAGACLEPRSVSGATIHVGSQELLVPAPLSDPATVSEPSPGPAPLPETAAPAPPSPALLEGLRAQGTAPCDTVLLPGIPLSPWGPYHPAPPMGPCPSSAITWPLCRVVLKCGTAWGS